ncbi:uncharacterized protein LOC131157044 isoform X2 [Malania oleifera]|uniref:uncharacterized protein LOC131157044 isoform X2 n=1 Tax=Malania oleifera TaxID=397392 RepID=UPI0025AE6CF9|nr:uncharacterized protein LOC131157044 isoform X2 [Malania oleifera]
MAGLGGGADDCNIHRPQINRSLVNLNDSNPILHHSVNCEEKGSAINATSSAVQYDCLQRLDGNFLTLSIGGTAARSKSNIHDANIDSKTDSALYLHAHGQHATRSSLNQGESTSGSLLSSLNSMGGFPSLVHCAGDLNSLNDDLGVLHGNDAGLSSSPLHMLQKQASDVQHNILFINRGSLALAESRDARFENIDSYTGLQGCPIAPLRSYASSQVSQLDCGNAMFAVPSESAKTVKFAAQPASDQLQKRVMKTDRSLLPKSSTVSPFLAGSGNTIRKVQLGPLGSPVPPSGYSGPAFATGQVTPVKKESELAQTLSTLDGVSLKRKAIYPAPATPQMLRRKAIPPPLVVPSVQFPLQTGSSPHIKSQNRPAFAPNKTAFGQTAPTLRKTFINEAVPAVHIKWRGFNGIPQLSGLECPLCKRDLSYPPEGPVYQPTDPPATAVLPCGHVYHDRCLGLVTPEDQSDNPVCIPCVLSAF